MGASLEFVKIAVMCIILITLSRTHCRQQRQFDLAPDLPEHMPSPPAPKPKPAAADNAAAGGVLPEVPPQNLPFGPAGPGVLPGEFVPFGLNHVILIVVPQFKTKFRKLPNWVHSSVRVAMPVTVFFDLLEYPPGMFLPGAGLLPPVPQMPPPPSPISPTSPIPGPGMMSGGQTNYQYYPQTQYLHEYDGDPNDPSTDSYNENNFYSEDERSFGKKRRKRETFFANQTTHANFIPPEINEHQAKKIRRKRAVNYNHTLHRSERATIIPKLEKILNNAGLEGKSCLLRAVCEVHEAPLNHYGLVGELLTLFFSISRSIFAESHLAEYVQAEEAGRFGDCAEFYKECKDSMFSWEKIERKKMKMKRL